MKKSRTRRYVLRGLSGGTQRMYFRKNAFTYVAHTVTDHKHAAGELELELSMQDALRSPQRRILHMHTEQTG